MLGSRPPTFAAGGGGVSVNDARRCHPAAAGIPGLAGESRPGGVPAAEVWAI